MTQFEFQEFKNLINTCIKNVDVNEYMLNTVMSFQCIYDCLKEAKRNIKKQNHLLRLSYFGDTVIILKMYCNNLKRVALVDFKAKERFNTKQYFVLLFMVDYLHLNYQQVSLIMEKIK